MTERELIELKQEIDEARDLYSKLQGQKEALMQQLKEEYNCTSTKQAQKMLIKMGSEIDEINDEINKGLEELEKMFYDET